MKEAGTVKEMDHRYDHRSDPALLINSLRENILRNIEKANSLADIEIKKIDAAFLDEIEQYRALQQKEYEEKIKYEESKMRNLLSTEIKKQKLEIIESFINSLISGASSSIRSDPRYVDFLKMCVVNAFKDIKGKSATVLISQEDLNFSDDIMKVINSSGYNLNIRISADNNVLMGGAMVIDDETEVVYNNTIERIIYRKSGEIRREIVRNLQDIRAI
ncbi:MAG: V-type ATP synthase subunit E family protein [Spirochaetota bacterium]